jgi:hypothetical protein
MEHFSVKGNTYALETEKGGWSMYYYGYDYYGYEDPYTSYYGYEDPYTSQQQLVGIPRRVATLESEVRRMNRQLNRLERRVAELERRVLRPSPRGEQMD